MSWLFDHVTALLRQTHNATEPIMRSKNYLIITEEKLKEEEV